MYEAPDFVVDAGERRLNGWSGGADHGPVLLFQPGTPMPPVHWGALDDIARHRGLRLVAYARPGYSGSSRLRGRSVSDVAGDVSLIMDHLGADTFVTLGHSGGGPHALACAALLSDRCIAAATLGGVAPFDLFGPGWMSGMADENVEEFSVVLEGENVLRPYLENELSQYADVTADDVADSLRGLVSQVDRDALTGDLADMMARSLRRAARDGIDGWVDDDLAFARPWGFDLGSLRVPVTVWQGRQDRMVPFSHGEWLVSAIPTATPRLLEEEGHISLMTRLLEGIVADLDPTG